MKTRTCQNCGITHQHYTQTRQPCRVTLDHDPTQLLAYWDKHQWEEKENDPA